MIRADAHRSPQPARSLRPYGRQPENRPAMTLFIESVVASTDNRKRMLFLSILSFIVLL